MTLSFSIRALFIYLFFIFSQSIICQENQNYVGPLQIGPYSGIANYNYHISQNDTILDGPFEMQKSNLEALLSNEDVTFSFKGQFQENHANGSWQFEFGEFKSDSLTEVVGLQYSLNVSGFLENAKGKLSMGKPDGQWVYARNKIEKSRISEVLFESVIEFENGVPQKSFKIKNTDGTLVGRFLRDGLAHDEWTFYSEYEITKNQSWFFQNGQIKEIETEVNGQTEKIKFEKNSSDSQVTINLDSRFIKILSLKNKAAKEVLTKSDGVSNLLTENADYYKKIDTILSGLGEAYFLPEFKVKVDYYPLDSLEKKQLSIIRDSFKKSDSIGKSYLNDSQLNILKLSDREANYYYSIIEIISERYLLPIKDLLTLHDEKALEFIDRYSLFHQLWPNGAPSKDVNVDKGIVEKSDETFSGPNAADFDFTEKNLNGILHISNYAEASLKHIEGILAKKLAKVRRQKEIIAVEEKMISQINNLNRVIDSVDAKLPNEIITALERVNTFANTNLSAYSKMINEDEKLKYGRDLTICVENLQDLELAILDQPEKNERVTMHYQDEVWNPFMANLMTEDVKKRITSAYGKVLIPYLLNQVRLDLDCSNAAELVSLFNNSYERIMTLREEDTRKLERRLKRERDPDVIIQLLGIDPQIKLER